MESSPSPSPISIHLPLGLLSLAVGVFLAAQIGAADQGAKTMDWQIGNLQKQVAQVKDSKVKMSEVLADREDPEKQSKVVLENWQKVFIELLELAKTDADAQKVVAKWKITPGAAKDSAAATPAESPATTPAPTTP